MVKEKKIVKIKERSERKIPNLSFTIRIIIPVSLSTDDKTKTDFVTLANNEGLTISQKLRTILYEMYGAKDESEFNDLIVDEITDLKDGLFALLKAEQKFKGNNWLSKAFEDRIKKEYQEKILNGRK